jgi:sugar phosphate isomerase/epimerase
MPREELAKVGRDTMNEVLALPDARKLSWNFETHDHWIASKDCLLLLNFVTDPAFGALWDIGHTPRVAGEPPEETFAAIGPRVRYAHVKDAVKKEVAPGGKGDGWQYVLPGEGQLPLDRAIRVLQKGGYDGWLLFEHEKRWHPELPEPEIAFPAYVKWARPIISSK